MTDPRGDLLRLLPPGALDAIERLVGVMVAERQQPPPRRWLTIDEAAAYIGSGRQRIYDLRTRGRLSKTGDGGRVLVDRHELDALIERGLS